VGRPFPCCYWVEAARLLAGEYPGSFDRGEARRRISSLLEAGVTFVLDLTEDGELEPYSEFLGGARSIRLPIPDFSAPTVDEMARILDTIDEAVARGDVVYVHCWGGRGRTGTVIACHLVRHGLEPDAALARVGELLAQTPNAGRASPETEQQVALVHSWRPGR
jgi:protein-tyrosine phosphatase